MPVSIFGTPLTLSPHPSSWQHVIRCFLPVLLEIPPSLSSNLQLLLLLLTHLPFGCRSPLLSVSSTTGLSWYINHFPYPHQSYRQEWIQKLVVATTIWTWMHGYLRQQKSTWPVRVWEQNSFVSSLIVNVYRFRVTFLSGKETEEEGQSTSLPVVFLQSHSVFREACWLSLNLCGWLQKFCRNCDVNRDIAFIVSR